MAGAEPLDSKATILVVDDEAAVRRVLVMRLQLSGYKVICAEDGEQALEMFHSESPDLIVLDVMLPKLDGFAVCRRLRAESCVPIIFLSAVEAISERVAGLDLGADDYVCKPFSLAELLGRIQALLRRSATLNSSLDESAGRNVHFGETVVDFASFKVLKQGRELPALPAKAFALLGCLVEKRGEAVTRDQLIDEVWGEEECITSRTLNNLIVKVRQAIESDPEQPRYLKTVHGVGYRLEL